MQLVQDVADPVQLPHAAEVHALHTRDGVVTAKVDPGQVETQLVPERYVEPEQAVHVVAVLVQLAHAPVLQLAQIDPLWYVPAGHEVTQVLE